MSTDNKILSSATNQKTVSWGGIGQQALLDASQGPGALFPSLTDVSVRLSYNLPGFEISGQVVDSLTSYAEGVIKTQGVFNPLIKDTSNGFIDRPLLQTNYDFGNPDYLMRNASIYQKTMSEPLLTLNNIFKAPLDMKGVPYIIDFSKNNSNNTLIFGPQSNTNIFLGDGNNLILNSPAMFAQVSTIYAEGLSYDYAHPEGFPTSAASINFILYPSMQGSKGSNTINTGNGNSIIYYDSSFSQIKTGNGNNTFVPSFGSFNWAYNNFYPSDIINKVSKYLSLHPTFNVETSNATWLTPITQQAASENAGRYQLYSNNDLYLISVNYFTKPFKPVEYIYKDLIFGKPNNATDASNVVIAALTPTIGGMTVIGGSGNDIFYGVDPSFYSYNPALDRGVAGDGNRTVFRTQNGNTTDERFSYQNFETIKFLGGGGNNIFNLGNPTKIQPDGLQFTGQYTYQLATSHTFLATEAQQKQLSYGNIHYGTNQVNVNLSVNINSYTNTTQTFDLNSGSDTSNMNIGNATSTILDAMADFSTVFKFLGPIAAGIDLSLAVKSIIAWIVPDPKPIKIESTALTQPLGDWKHAIEINDWNPGTVVNIAVDPTLTTAPDIARWNNIRFLIGTPDQSSDSVFGVSVKWQQGTDTEKTLFRFDGLGSSFYGYQSYNFATQKYQQIDQNNLAFFGTIALGINEINPLKNYTAGNGFIFSSSDPLSPSYSTEGSHLFYWNDVNNTTIDLNAARLSARSISIEFDSRSLGWSWDPKFTSSLSDQSKNVTQDEFKNSLKLDVEKSKLWVESDNGAWKYFTFSQFDTITEAYRSALLAKAFYQINGQKPIISDDQQTTNNLVLSLSKLQKVMPDLSKLHQTTEATKLTSLKQITYVEDFNSGSQDGVTIFYKLNPNDIAVYKIVVSENGSIMSANQPASQLILSLPTEKSASSKALLNPVASLPAIVDKSSLLEKEVTTHVDIDLNNIIGFSLADILHSEIFNISDNIILRAYESILERPFDDAGFRAWTSAIKAGADLGSVFEGFFCSGEYEKQSGSKSEFIDDLYAFLLNRIPEDSGKAGWLKALESGANYNEIVRDFISSKEFSGIIGIMPQG